MSGLTIRRPAVGRHEIDLRTRYRCASMAESGAIEAHGQSRALVSSEARDLPGSLSLTCVPPQGFGP